MIINMVGGGGGAALNFKVVPGLTQPGTASENTIWVKTEKIGAWYFSATQPEGMQEWDVWFPVGTSSTVEFNALRKNGIQVYPISAKQYISGAWVDKTAMSYQGGEWATWWNGELYTPGDEWINQTGGWYIAKDGGCTLRKNETGMVFNANSAGASSTIAMKKGTKLDFGNRNVIYMTIEAFTKTAAVGNPSFAMRFVDGDDVANATKISEKAVNGEVATETTYKLDIPSNTVKSFCIVAFCGELEIKKIWME